MARYVVNSVGETIDRDKYAVDAVEVTDYISAVTSATTGDSINLTNYGRKTFLTICSVHSSGTIAVNIQGSLDDTNWKTIDTQSFAAVGNDSYSTSDHYPYMRAVVDFITGSGVGTITCQYAARGL